MMQRGYLDSREMSNMFNLLRSNDLIWANVVNNYLLRQQAACLRSALLEQRWHAHGPRGAIAWYLQNTYVGEQPRQASWRRSALWGEPIDLGRVKLDIYAAGLRKSDHIVPWGGAWRVAQLRTAAA